MYECKSLDIFYPTGEMHINVGPFFTDCTKAQINKVLRLARDNCSEAQRKQLIEDVRFEYKYRENVLKTLDEHEVEMARLLSDCGFRYRQPIDPQKKAIRKDIAKLQALVETLKKARWNGNDSPPVD